jgi:hypothetical protein
MKGVPMKTAVKVPVIDVGGNPKTLTRLPMGCRMGNNANAFLGGSRLWEDPQT